MKNSKDEQVPVFVKHWDLILWIGLSFEFVRHNIQLCYPLMESKASIAPLSLFEMWAILLLWFGLTAYFLRKGKTKDDESQAVRYLTILAIWLSAGCIALSLAFGLATA